MGEKCVHFSGTHILEEPASSRSAGAGQHRFFPVLFRVEQRYIFKRYPDRDHDREHPEKSKRPIAAGLLRVEVIGGIAFLLAAFSLAAGLLDKPVLFRRPGRVCDHQRALYGQAQEHRNPRCHVHRERICPSGARGNHPCRRCRYGLVVHLHDYDSLFLGFSKRRQELSASRENAEKQRKVLADYSVPFLDQMISVATACTVMSYTLYTISP